MPRKAIPARRAGLLAAILVVSLSAFGRPLPAAATLCVRQGGLGGCFSTIAAAIAAAAPGDTITIGAAPTPYFERLTISKDIALMGDDAASTILDGSQAGRVISITFGHVVRLAQLTIQHGATPSNNTFSEQAAGIFIDHSQVVLDHVMVTNNATGDSPGNTGEGGGIWSFNAALTLVDSLVSANRTGAGLNSGDGAGIWSSGTLTVTRSTIRNNVTGSAGVTGTSGSGAGIYNLGRLTIDTSTLSGNLTGGGSPNSQHGTGGGVYNGNTGTANLINATIAFNQIDKGEGGGGVANAGGAVNLRNSILSNNHTQVDVNAVHDCSGSINSQGYNIVMVPDPCTITAITGDLLWTDPVLAPLQANGGPTPTHALLAGSPAIDDGDNSACGPTDQRGFARPVNGGLSRRCDIGAYEYFPVAVFLPLARRN